MATMGGFVPAQARQERYLLDNCPEDKRNFAPLVVSSLFAPSREMDNRKRKNLCLREYLTLNTDSGIS